MITSKIRYLSLFFILLLPVTVLGTLYHSINDGDFQSASNWSTGTVPDLSNPNDSVVVWHDMEIPLHGQYLVHGFLYINYGATIYTPNQFRIDGGHVIVWGMLDVHNNLWMENSGVLDIYYNGYVFVDNKVTTSGATINLIGGTICWHNLWKGPPPDGVGITLHKYCYISTGPLGIELLSFSVTCKENYVDIRWSTENEENNDHFTIERSRDLHHWSEIRRVPGSLNSNAVIDYGITDVPPADGVYYYRLSQTDKDGTLTVYGDQWLRFADCDLEPELILLPNPVSTSFQLFGLKQETTLKIFDIAGLLVKIEKVKPENNLIHLDNLNPGVYFLLVPSHEPMKIIKN